MQIKPTSNHVVVETVQEERVGSIVLPDSARKRSEVGKVIACGKRDSKGLVSATIDDTPPFNAGDVVVISKYAGQEFEFEGKKLLILSFSDVLATIAEN